MKLRYRGVDYDRVPPTVEVTEGEILGKYRGVNWRCHTLKEIPVPQPAYDLQYRGVAYNSGRKTAQQRVVQDAVVLSEPAVTEQSSLTPRRTVASSSLRQQMLSDLDRVHNTYIRKSLEHRLEVAYRRGDPNLIALLEAEKEQLA